ncbi:SET domain-containing protein-lysine N-methyltransferase [Pseudomonas sp. AKS31]|uniref:SET domain-containing protein-lysine N-methyltransferase n=1 Tax=Pseudomonas sp. AKS31 TaxID=2949091 RepID=UPI00202A49B8|nr:SET domain-containing protein-lysine N-methyltransferase [Pseudomonas sp. AKS31]MCL9800499.1 SET domain-containing protein [Pseudomonas sp. AKS31]
MNTSLSRFYSRTPPRRLQDINHLISYLHTLVGEHFNSDARDLYYHPPASSALGRECKEAFRILNKLEKDEDFIRHISTPIGVDKSPLGNDFLYDLVSFHLSSAKTPAPSPPEVFTIAGHSVILREVPIYWSIDVDVLLDIHRKVGNGVNSDGSVRLDLVLAYYSLQPMQPATSAGWQRLLHNLVDHRALWLLGHDGHVSDLEHLLGAAGDQAIMRIVRQIRLETSRSLLANLLPEKFNDKLDKLANTIPVALLETVLGAAKNLQLAQRIANELDWYGAGDNQQCPPGVLKKLLWRALWLEVKPDPDSHYRNELQILIETGSRYSSIRQSLVEHFQRTLCVNRTTALLAVAIFKSNIASEAWVEDIPEDLPYGTSSTWVNFKSGFILAETIAPGSSRYMTFEQLLNLPAEHYQAHANDVGQQRLVTAAKARAALDWSVETGLLGLRRTPYSLSEVELAVQTLEQHERDMVSAMENLTLRPPSRFRHETDTAFDEAFRSWLDNPRAAYATLIKALLSQYLPACGTDLERDEVIVYSLRLPLHDTQVEHENRTNTDAVRARSGFILRTVNPAYPTDPRYIEVFPFAGVVRLRKEMKSLQTGGEIVVEKIGSSSRTSRGSFRKGTELPFDWEAYRDGSKPRENQHATLIVEQIAETFEAVAIEQRSPDVAARTLPFAANNLTSARAEKLAAMIARELFFKDESALLEQTRKATRSMDIGRDFIEDITFWGKMFVPFWGSIEDLTSGDPRRIESGGLGLFTDVVSFGLPVGKYVAGCTRLLSGAGRIGLRLALPKLSAMTRTLLVSTLRELNPLESVIGLLRLGRFALGKLSNVTLRHVRMGIAHLRDGTIAARHLQSVDPATWVPHQAGDQLFTVEGIADIPMRNVGTAEAPDFRLIDPVTHQAFGPRYRQPVTVISNSSPLIRQYAVEPHWIQGLKADSRGIFFRPDHNQKFICNVDEHGTIAVYQIRDNSYGFIAETAQTGENSFSVVLVNPKTNRDLSINLSSVRPGHWYTREIRVSGGAPDQPNAVTPLHLQKWSQFSEVMLDLAIKAFAKNHGLDRAAFQQFVHTQGQLKPLGQQMLDQANTARTAIAFDHLQNWRTLSQESRTRLTREGFAAEHNLDPQDFLAHVNMDGTFRAPGTVLAKYANNQTFTPLTPAHLEQWRARYDETRSASTMNAFVAENDLNPVLWATFVNDAGQLRSAVPETLQLLTAVDSNAMSARKSLPPGTARKSAPWQLPEQSTVRGNGPPSPPKAGPSKRPRLDDMAAALPEDLTPSLGHNINNNAPILQDPEDVRTSLTKKLEGDIEKIAITDANRLLTHFQGARLKEMTRRITEDIHEWIADEGRHHDRLTQRFEVRRPTEGPERGLSVFAKVDIEPYEVLGPYIGKLHRTGKSLRAEILEKSREKVSTYLYETATKNATLSGHGNSNVLSLINAINVPGQANIGIENVGSICVGKYMVFFVAWEKIPAGSELFLDYGANYWKHMKP